MGINRGMSLSHLHTLQGIRRLQYFIGHIANNDGVGKLIRICVEATQLEVGTFKPFLFLQHSFHGNYTLTSMWVHELCSFLELFKGTITLTNSWIPFLQRQIDQAFMSLVITSTHTKGELRQINMCRLYLRVISVSDITDTIEHVCDNKSTITATWKDENISVFDNTKPYADAAKVARSSIAALQPFSTAKYFWVE
jgi:hypothetical protein